MPAPSAGLWGAHSQLASEYPVPSLANADQTNGCIAMVMGNAYTSDTVVYDHIHRRDTESNGIQEYPAQVLRHHERFTRDITELTWQKSR
jgi:hypothetical protein